jgi:hypothetical protein
MRLTIAIGILLAVCLGAVASSDLDKCPASAQALPLCTILADAAKYDGKEITVRGLYRMVIHGSVLMGTTCSQIEVNTRQAAGYKADKQAVAVVRSLTKKNQFQPVDEVLRGTFRVAQKEQCFGQICAPYEIEVTELLCASAPTDKRSSTRSRQAQR